MQRFQITGIYTIGVVGIVVLAIWGVSFRCTAGTKSTAPMSVPQTSAENQPPQANSVGSTRPPDMTPAQASGVAKVSIDNFHFVPQELVITAGTTVTWVNTDDVPHTASSNSTPSAFDSKALDTDDKYSFQFNTPGSYDYYCKVHPHMVGRIIVK